jgi:hypothetical protein
MMRRPERKDHPVSRSSSSQRLRLVLRANAAFSLIGGLIAVAAGPWVSERLGIDHVAVTRLLGAGLIVFAGDVANVSRRTEPKLLRESALVSAADFTWVAATVVVLLTGILNTTGVVVASAIGLAVADFGMTQLWFRAKALAPRRAATLAV